MSFCRYYYMALILIGQDYPFDSSKKAPKDVENQVRSWPPETRIGLNSAGSLC